ncbi:HAMP domain-containing histidine kinase [Patescibacteria group bacterium]|nr:HAMP domain-containing histidine kinase [Patescibacteria group bacterium]
MEMIRSIILFAGWPVLILGSIIIILKAHGFYKRTNKLPLGKLILAETFGTLISMYSLGIVATFLMFCDVEKGVKIVLPVFIVWFITMIIISYISWRWRKEAAKINILYYKIKERTEKLKKEKTKLSHIAENMETGAIFLDNSGKPMFINKEAKAIINSKSDSDRKLLEALYKKFSKYKLKKHVEECVNGNPSNIIDVEIDDKIYEIFLRCLIDHTAEVRGYFGHFIWIRDVTEEKGLEQAKNKFLTIASHKLRTPLAGIKGAMSLLESTCSHMKKEQKELLDDARQCTEIMSSVVNKLFYASEAEIKKMKVNLEKTQLDGLVKKAIDKTKDGKIKFKKQKDIIYALSTDSDLLSQAIESLLDNAVIYSESDVLVGLKKEEKEFIISVKDDGIGISKPEQKKVFTKFFRAENAMKRYTEGSGLNLNITKHIIQSLDGRIWFESKLNKGSTFYIALPEKIKKSKLRK